MAIFTLSKICQKFKKNLTDLIFGVKVTTIKVYHCAKFEANPINDVQNFPQKLKFVHIHPDIRTYDGRHVIAIATWSDGPRWLKMSK